jgi:D-alanyl-D-alanine carboxypeptidase
LTDLRVLEQAHGRRSIAGARAGRRWRQAGLALLTIGLTAVALLAFMASGASGPTSVVIHRGTATGAQGTPTAATGYGILAAPAAWRLAPHSDLRMRSGLVFDVRSGHVLWQRDPTKVMPIASLTKMMTALVVNEHARPDARVLITRDAVRYSGSGVGLLPLGKRVSLRTLLYGLLLPSGNDAAIALAEHVAGTQGRFIGMMNAQAGSMGLRCTHFSSVSGIVDQGNHSCAIDLAVMTHALLRRALLARIVGARSAVLPFPIKGGKLYLYNNNPLLLSGYPGANGVKTGYTVTSGKCLVATARRGRTWLAVVLLHSNNPPEQAARLLNEAFARVRAAGP